MSAPWWPLAAFGCLAGLLLCGIGVTSRRRRLRDAACIAAVVFAVALVIVMARAAGGVS